MDPSTDSLSPLSRFPPAHNDDPVGRLPGTEVRREQLCGASHLAASLLPASLLVVHDPRGRRHDDDAELWSGCGVRKMKNIETLARKRAFASLAWRDGSTRPTQSSMSLWLTS